MTLERLLILAGIVFFFGLCGGFLNAVRAGQGRSLLPDRVTLPGAGGAAPAAGGAPGPQPDSGWQPGLLLNTLTGGVAAVLSWGLYGPLAQMNVLNLGATIIEDYVMTLSAIAGAFFVGYGGARWLSAEADKSILQTSSSAMGNSAATAANGASMIASNTAELASSTAALAGSLAAGGPVPQNIQQQANSLSTSAEQVQNAAEQLGTQSAQLQNQAQQIYVGQTPVNVLDLAQQVAGSAQQVAGSAQQVRTIVQQQAP